MPEGQDADLQTRLSCPVGDQSGELAGAGDDDKLGFGSISQVQASCDGRCEFLM